MEVIFRQLGSFEVNKIASKTTFLDPRLKKPAFRLEENTNNVQRWLTNELTQMIEQADNLDTDAENKEPSVPNKKKIKVNYHCGHILILNYYK